MKKELQNQYFKTLKELQYVVITLLYCEETAKERPFTEEEGKGYQELCDTYNERIKPELKKIYDFLIVKNPNNSIIEEIEECIYQSGNNAKGFIWRMLDNFRTIPQTVNNNTANGYLGGIAYDELSYYYRNFINQVRQLCYNFDIEFPDKYLLDYVNHNKEVTQTRQIIDSSFLELDRNKSWEYAFRCEKDYYVFSKILTEFFELKEYSLPSTPIKMQKRCKTRLAQTLGEIHDKLSNADNLAGDKKYFEIIRCLDVFRDSTDAQITKDLQR